MKSRKTPSSTKGKIAFFIPFVILTGLVAFQILSYALTPKTGTLQVDTLVAPYHGGFTEYPFKVSIDGTIVTTPSQVTEPQGQHIVSFPPLTGYSTPLYQSVTVLPAKTTFANGIYTPLFKVIITTDQGFNATKVTAIHGITPVEWVNTSTKSVTIQGVPWDTASINPGGNFTYVFEAAGTFSFALFANQNATGLVTVT